MAKHWVITLEHRDKSSAKRKIETVSGRKKITQIEQHLCAIYRELQIMDDSDLASFITRVSGLATMLEKSPYILRAELIEI